MSINNKLNLKRYSFPILGRNSGSVSRESRGKHVDAAEPRTPGTSPRRKTAAFPQQMDPDTYYQNVSTPPRNGKRRYSGRNMDMALPPSSADSSRSSLASPTSAQFPPANDSNFRAHYHRKTNAICVPNDIDDMSPMALPLDGRCVSDSAMDVPPQGYRHAMSPQRTIENTNEQLRRNSVGQFASLSEFAQLNHIDVAGRQFVDEPVAPKIDLGM